MSYSAANPERSAPANRESLQTVSMLLFLAVAFTFLIRFNISPQIMNRIVNYTDDGGSFIEKLHVGTYALFLLLPFAFFARPFTLRGEEIGKFRVLLRFSVLMAALVPYLFLTGRAGSSGFIIDTYLAASAAGLVMLTFDDRARHALGDIVLGMLILSALIGIMEAVTHIRVLPYDLNEVQFRPIGLSNHPLALGSLCATAIGFTVLARWPVWLRILAVFVLFVGCAASGARFALLLGGVEVMALVLFTRWQGLTPRNAFKAKLIVFLITLVLASALITAMYAGGLLNRFGTSIFDENFMARVTIYRVFDYVSWRDIMLGMNVKDLLAIVNQKLHLPYIESAPVVITLLFGLPIALFFAWLLVWMLLRMLRGAPTAAWIGAFTYVLTALSNNALSSKNPEIAILLVLLVAYSGRARVQPNAP